MWIVERIGVIGICGMGGIALNAVAVDKREKRSLPAPCMI